MTELKRVLERLTSPYDDRSWLECDGLTRVLAYVLASHGIPYEAFIGTASFRGRCVSPHFWIVCGDWTVDYRLRMWLGPSAPHGVFRASLERSRRLSYEGHKRNIEIGRALAEILAGRSLGG